MTVWSFCPNQIKDTLSRVEYKNKGDYTDLVTYRTLWTNWIHDFSGCQLKKQWAISNGIHDAIVNQIGYKHSTINKFYAFNTDYKFYPVILRPYKHEIISPSQIKLIEPNSYVLVSQPNHEGKITDWFYNLVEHCQFTKTSIFLDCAFYGTTFDKLDTSDSVFDAVAFSLSKNFLLAGLRAGIVYGDELSPTLTIPINRQFSYNYFNSNAVMAANAILPKFKHTYITEFAKPRQIEFCCKNDLIPADIWMWAFNKAGDKICITDHIKNDIQTDLNLTHVLPNPLNAREFRLNNS